MFYIFQCCRNFDPEIISVLNNFTIGECNILQAVPLRKVTVHIHAIMIIRAKNKKQYLFLIFYSKFGNEGIIALYS